jgi:ATP-dependent DNA helicase RecG
MMPEDLIKLIRQGEGYHLEFKQSIPSKASDLAEEICPTGTDKPYSASGSVIIRKGPNSEKLITAMELREFYHDSDCVFFDGATCKHFKYPEDFDSALFRQILSIAGISNALPEFTILENLHLVGKAQQLKNAAVLLFAKNPQKYYEHAITRCVLFKGINKAIILDNKVFEGQLLYQYKSALDYLRQKLNLNYIIEDGGPRKEVLEIPEAVFREALVNALCHRNYYTNGAVTVVEIYDDRVEITNPGGLTQKIAKEEFGTKSFSRNPQIFGLFQRMDLVEKIGSGITRMQTEMRLAGLPAPTFSLHGIFAAKFYRPVEFDKWLESVKDNLNDKQCHLLQRLNQFPLSTTKQLAEAIDTTTRTIERHIAVLKELGILERIGTDKDGHYFINKK